MSAPQEHGPGPLADTTDTRAELLRRWRERAAPLVRPSRIEPRTADAADLPLSLAQERLWFLEQLQPGTAAYHLFFCGRLGAPVDPEVLSGAVQDLVDRHEVLRTTFAVSGGRPRQLVGAGLGPRLATVDLRSRDRGPQEAVALMEEAIHEPFDLRRGPLARVLLFRCAGGEVLGIVVHHLVADGWSLGVALRELSELCEARAGGRATSLPPMPLQYADVAVWQRDRAAPQAWQRDLEYWRARLAGAEPLELLADRSRPRMLSLDGDWCELRISQRLSDRLRALARAEDTTLYTVLLTGLATLLHLLSGQRDITVGTATANRDRPEYRGLIGNFVNMVALRTAVEGDPTVRDLLARAGETCLSALAHRQVPFERVVEELRPERDLSRSVLFQVLFVLQPPTTELRFMGAPVQPVEVGSRTVRADLEFHLWDRPALEGRLAFSTDLFDRTTAAAITQRFETVLEQMVAGPGRRLSTVSPLLEAERRLLDDWGLGPEVAVEPVAVHDLIARRAAASPGAGAVVAADGQLTFGQLEARSNRLANHLRSLGVGPEDAVGVCLERGAGMVVAVLAVLKAGGAYLPLDPTYPEDRLAFMVHDAGARVLVTTRNLEGKVRAPTLVRLDADRQAIATAGSAPTGVRAEPGSLAYTIYTSGSTGGPKGVQVSHRSLANLAAAMQHVPGLRSTDTVLSVASLSFDASVAELFPPLAAGARVVVAPDDALVDGRRLRDLASRHGVTVLQATATQWRLVQSAGGLDLPGLTALCGGEATAPDLARALASAHEHAWNFYGPTEGCVWTSSARLRLDGPVSLGRPLANICIRLVDSELRQVPVGAAGELCVGGAGLARGYLARPALTAERFVPDPWAATPGERLYRTGDLARYRADGTLEFLGRSDDQVKLRGHRIELGEIEAALAAHPDVDQAAAALRDEGAGGPRLVAYVVPSGTAATGTGQALTATLAAHLRSVLPAYMVPAAFLVLHELPLTATGKIDRRRLPPPGRTPRELGTAYVAPRTGLEREIATLAADVLEVERVGLDDDFFELGGHSLAAARLIAELQTRYGVELALQELFVTPTAGRLATLVQRELSSRVLLASEGRRIRDAVADLPESAVDALLADLLGDQAPGGLRTVP